MKTEIKVTNVCCAACQSQSTQASLRSFFCKHRNLDGKPTPFLYGNSIQRCPHCGYCASDISATLDNTERNKIREMLSEKNRDAGNSVGDYALQAAGFCSGTVKEYRYLLLSAWLYEESGHAERALQLRGQLLQTKAATILWREGNLTDSECLQIADTARQAGQFDKAGEVIAWLNLDFRGRTRTMSSLLEQELRLIEKKDKNPAAVKHSGSNERGNIA